MKNTAGKIKGTSKKRMYSEKMREEETLNADLEQEELMKKLAEPGEVDEEEEEDDEGEEEEDDDDDDDEEEEDDDEGEEEAAEEEDDEEEAAEEDDISECCKEIQESIEGLTQQVKNIDVVVNNLLVVQVKSIERSIKNIEESIKKLPTKVPPTRDPLLVKIRKRLIVQKASLDRAPKDSLDLVNQIAADWQIILNDIDGGMKNIPTEEKQRLVPLKGAIRKNLISTGTNREMIKYARDNQTRVPIKNKEILEDTMTRIDKAVTMIDHIERLSKEGGIKP